MAMAAALPARGAVFGLDLGTRTIGLATSDATRTVASPLETLRRTKFTRDAEALFARMDHRAVVGLVLGWPREMDGREGSRCQATRAFADNLLKIRDIPLLFWDERLSTSAVQRMMVEEFDLSRGRRAAKVDAAAAAYILQGALEALARGRPVS
ncbi:Holliday junction resolvase RuvX [Roseospira visakhapatnamensis]|nr:Holliday junction resolvase RuvX [Roseospira visakhapatnamensis]